MCAALLGNIIHANFISNNTFPAGLNAKLYWENDDPAHTVSLVPTSAVTGEGVPDLLMMLITLTQVRKEKEEVFMLIYA